MIKFFILKHKHVQYHKSNQINGLQWNLHLVLRKIKKNFFIIQKNIKKQKWVEQFETFGKWKCSKWNYGVFVDITWTAFQIVIQTDNELISLMKFTGTVEIVLSIPKIFNYALQNGGKILFYIHLLISLLNWIF